MSHMEDMENRLSVVEEEVRQIRKSARAATIAEANASAARTLAAGAYEEVGEVKAKLDAHTRTLNALREDQLDLKKEVSDLRAHVDEGFAKLNLGMAQIVALLTLKEGEEKED